MSKKDVAEFKRVRADIAEMLGYRADKLTTAQQLRVDGVLALKVALDEMRAKLFRGEQIDHAKMLSLSEAIERYLPAEAKPDPTPSIFRQDPKKVLEQMVRRWVETDEAGRAEQGLSPRLHDPEEQQRRIDALEAENAALRGILPAADPTVALPAPERVITPSDGDVVPPSEQSDRAENMRGPVGTPPKAPLTMDGQVLRPGMGPDGKPIPPVAVSGDEAKRRMAAVNADRATPHRIMHAPARVKGEPEPSTPMTMYGDSGFF